MRSRTVALPVWGDAVSKGLRANAVWHDDLAMMAHHTLRVMAF
jgi:hypothetical protein